MELKDQKPNETPNQNFTGGSISYGLTHSLHTAFWCFLKFGYSKSDILLVSQIGCEAQRHLLRKEQWMMKSCGAECNGHKHPSIFFLSHSKVNGFQKSSSLSGASAGSSVKCSLTQSNIIIKESFWHIFRTLSCSLNHSGLRAIHHVTVSASLEGFFGLQWSQRSTVFYSLCCL